MGRSYLSNEEKLRYVIAIDNSIAIDKSIDLILNTLKYTFGETVNRNYIINSDRFIGLRKTPWDVSPGSPEYIWWGKSDAAEFPKERLEQNRTVISIEEYVALEAQARARAMVELSDLNDSITLDDVSSIDTIQQVRLSNSQQNYADIDEIRRPFPTGTGLLQHIQRQGGITRDILTEDFEVKYQGLSNQDLFNVYEYWLGKLTHLNHIELREWIAIKNEFLTRLQISGFFIP